MVVVGIRNNIRDMPIRFIAVISGKVFEDPLQFLMKLLGYNHEQKISRVYRKILILCCTIFQVVNIASLLTIIKIRQLGQYISLIFLTQPTSFMLLATIITMNKMQQIKDMTFQYCWGINTVSEKIEHKILHQCKNFKIFSTLTILMTTGCHLLIALPLVGDEEDISFPMFVIHKYFPLWTQPIFCFVYYCLAFIGSLGLVYPVLLGLYMTHHLTFQLMLLNEYVRKISEDFNYFTTDNIYYDEKYQSAIYQRLTIIVAHHVNIRKLTQFYVNIFKIIMLYIPLGSVVPATVIYFIYFEISPPSNFRMMVALLTFCIMALSLCINGQRFNDNNSMLFQLASQTPWIYWNKKNRGALLLLLTATSNPIPFNTYIVLDINYRLLFTFVKWTYSMITVFYHSSI